MKKFFSAKIITSITALVCCSSAWSQTSDWKPVGPMPFPVNASGQINGIGRVSQLKFDPTNSNRLFAVAPHAVFVSSNLAVNWAILPGTDDLPTGTNLASISIDYSNPNILYLGTGDANYYSTGSGVWKSTDGGITFTLSNTGMGNKLAEEIIMSPTDPNSLVAATNAGIYKSTNGGASWQLTSPVTRFTDMCLKTGSGTVLFAVSSDNQNFYSSTDFGTTWITKTLSPTLPSKGGRVAVTPANPNMVYVSYVGSNTASAGGIVYQSVDGGANFTLKKGDNTPNLNGYTGTSSGQGGYNYDIEADPLDANTLYSCGHIIWKSTNGGATWVQSQSSWGSVLHTDQHQFLFHPTDPNKLFNANDGGVWLNTNRVATNSWTPTSDGLAATEFYNFGNSRIYKNLIGGGSQDNGELYYRDGDWKTNRGGDWTSPYFFDNTSNNAYYVENGKRRDLLNNPSGSELSIGLPAVSSKTDQYTASCQNGNIGFYANNSGAGVYRTPNLQSANAVWTALSGFTPSTQILAMAVSPVDANVLYILQKNKTVVRSTNALGAASFLSIAAAPQPSGQPANGGLAVFQTGVVYLSSDGYVFRSADLGASWSPVGSGSVTNTLKTQKIKKIIVDTLQASTETVYAYTSQGVYYINNTMTDWAYMGLNLPTTASLTGMELVSDLLNPFNSLLRVSSYGRGMWEMPVRSLEGSAPTVTISAPLVNASFTAGSLITIEATASDADGSVAKVEFYQGSTKLGEDLDAPYSFTWTSAAQGVYSLTAKATDELGNQTVSDPIAVLVDIATPVADAYVRDGGSADTNFGTASGLTLKKDGAGFSREVYLKFDLSSLTSKDYAFLRLNIASANSSVANTNWQLYYVPDDSWTETGITWNNKPAATTLLGEIKASNLGWAEWNVTQQTLSELAGDRILTLKLVSTVAGGTTDATFNSRDTSAQLRPQLVFRSENTVPTVSITSPAPYALLSSPLTINATASDLDGTIAKVEFFEGNNKLGEDLEAPYSFTWNKMPMAKYILTAKATDNAGAIATSEPLSIEVNCPGGMDIPQANLRVIYFDSQETVGENAPATNAIDGNPATIWHTKWAGGVAPLPHEIQLSLGGTYSVNRFKYLPRSNAGNGTVARYEIYVSMDSLNWGTPVDTGTFAKNAMEKVVTFPVKPGRFVRFRALSEINGQQYTSAAELKVGTCSPTPVVTITSPLNNTNLTEPASLTIEADARNWDGEVAKVEFFEGSTKLGEDLEAPYSFTWSGAAQGVYSITARATDNAGIVGTSTPINVVVNCPRASYIPQANLKVIYFDSQETVGENAPATNVIDGDPATFWHSKWWPTADPLPHEIQLSLGGSYFVNRFMYVPRTNSVNGRTGKYEIYVSMDSLDWGTPVDTGTFANNALEKVVIFPEKLGKYVRFRALSEVNGQQFTTAAELNVGICSSPPAVTITTPANNATINTSTVTITATASDMDGSVTKVEFFEGSIKLGEDLEAPYSFDWTGVVPGTYSLTAKATDNGGLTAETTPVIVTIKDITAPVLTIPTNILADNVQGLCGAVVNFAATASDDFSPATISFSQQPGTQFPVGTTTVTVTATDASGNNSIGTFSVTVKDSEKPVVNCPANQQFCFEENGNYTVPALTATDNCTVSSISYQVSGATTRSGTGNNASGAFNPGVSTILWTVTDAAGNVTTSETAVTVNPNMSGTIADVYAVATGGSANTIYLGYGPASLTFDVTATGGTAPYSYRWSTGSTASSAFVNPSAVGVYNYTVTITDASGCAKTVSKSISVVDIRCDQTSDKVTICHKPSSNHDNTLCIGVSSVESHLQHGCTLGGCNAAFVLARKGGASDKEADEQRAAGLLVKVYPNPSSSDFQLLVQSNSDEEVRISLKDIQGRLLKLMKVTPGTLFSFGRELKAGTYIVEVLQGKKQESVKLIKQ